MAVDESKRRSLPARIVGALRRAARNPAAIGQSLKVLEPFAAALSYGSKALPERSIANCVSPNPLRDAFEAVTEGPGVWKWTHYFEHYHRHCERFVGRSPRVMEVGIYSGGSLGMWRRYFGDEMMIYGVDIEPACRAYAAPRTEILIGDQSDRAFWARVKCEIEPLDIFIDDGSHHPDHQILTLQEMLPHLRPGGVYVCEDVHGLPNRFGAFASGLAALLTSMQSPVADRIASIHYYPSLIVIETTNEARVPFESVRRGTLWEPFLDGGQYDPKAFRAGADGVARS